MMAQGRLPLDAKAGCSRWAAPADRGDRPSGQETCPHCPYHGAGKGHGLRWGVSVRGRAAASGTDFNTAQGAEFAKSGPSAKPMGANGLKPTFVSPRDAAPQLRDTSHPGNLQHLCCIALVPFAFVNAVFLDSRVKGRCGHAERPRGAVRPGDTAFCFFQASDNVRTRLGLKLGFGLDLRGPSL